MKSKKNIHYCWLIVLGSWFVMLYGVGIAITSFSVFLVPLEAKFSFSHTGTSAIITVASVGALFSTLVSGKLSKKIGCRRFIGICGIVGSCCFFCYSYCHTLIQFYIVAFVLGLAEGGGVIVPCTILINNWFHKKRGFAIGLAFSGSGFGAMVFSPLLTYFIKTYGVLETFKLEACMVLSFSLIAVLLFRETPQSIGLNPYGYVEHSEKTYSSLPVSFRCILRLPQYYFLCAAAFLIGLTILGVNNQIPSFLISLGYDPMFAASIISFFNLVLIGGKILYGTINDHKGERIGNMYIFLMWGSAISCLFLIPHFGFFCIIFAILCGLGNPIATVTLPIWTMSFFGKKNYNIIYPTIMIMYLIGQSIGTVLIGIIVDLSGSYLLGFGIFLIVIILAYFLVQKGYHLIHKYTKN